MKKLFLIVGLSLALCTGGLALTPATASAENVLNPVCSRPEAADSAVCKDNAANSATNPIFGPDGIATVIMGWMAKIVGIAALIMCFIAGIMITTSGGESSEAATGRKALTYALIGLVVALFAQAIVSFVLTKLSV